MDNSLILSESLNLGYNYIVVANIVIILLGWLFCEPSLKWLTILNTISPRPLF